jgi:microcystin-dependent protein
MSSSFRGVQNASNTNFNSIYSYILNTMFMVGDYKYSASTVDFNDWFVCDGRELTTAEYPELFAIIGTNFGSDGSGFFNIPDFRGRLFGCVGIPSTPNDTGTTHALGDDPGEETIVLTVGQLATHLHTGTTDSSGAHVHGVTDPGHTHTYTNQPNDHQVGNTGITTDSADNVPVGQTTGSSVTGVSINSSGVHTHTFTSNNTGSNEPHDNIQPTLYGGNVFILTKSITYFSNSFNGISPVSL